MLLQKVHQQRGVQVQCFAAAAGQLDRKLDVVPCFLAVDMAQILLEVKRFLAALGLFGDLCLLGVVVGLDGSQAALGIVTA